MVFVCPASLVYECSLTSYESKNLLHARVYYCVLQDSCPSAHLQSQLDSLWTFLASVKKKKRKKETEQCTFYVYLNLCPFRHIICSFRITYSYWVTSLVCMVMDRHPIRVPSSLMSSVPGIVYSTTMTLTRIKQKEVFAFTYCTSVLSLPFVHWRKEVFEQKCEKLLFPGYIM